MLNVLNKSIRWTMIIAVITFVLAAIFSVISTILLGGVGWALGMAIVFGIVFVGIVSDMLGVASTAATEAPMHAMAAEKVKGAKQAIQIVRNADRFSNFCNDVIGDIAGIISGTASAAVVLTISINVDASPPLQQAVNVIFASVVAAMTVGGKAIGKSFAIHYANHIILKVGEFFYLLEEKLKIKVFRDSKDRKRRAKQKAMKASGRFGSSKNRKP
ncbi:hypothetical protein G4V62_01025 [Bacillaceae bacterium SIJ1]|nr:hypothetical protein [Litoribacterium kuwaitense]